MNANGALEPFTTGGHEANLTTTARADLRVQSFDAHGEIRLLRTDGEPVGVIGDAAKSAGVGHANQVPSGRGCGEQQHGIGPRLTAGIIVVLVVQSKHGQAIGNGPTARRIRLHEVGRLIERMRQRRSSKDRLTTSFTGIHLEPRIRPARIEPQAHHLAIGIQVFVQFHFGPVLESKVIDGVGVLAPEGEPRIANGLKHRLLHRLAGQRQDLQTGVHRRTIARSTHFQGQRLASAGLEGKMIHIARTPHPTVGFRRYGHRLRPPNPVVGLQLCLMDGRTQGLRRAGSGRTARRRRFFRIAGGGRNPG